MAEELREATKEESRGREEQENRAAPHLRGLGTAARKLAHRVQKDQLPKWHRVSGKLSKLQDRLAEAESSDELRKIARSAMAPQTGIFRKIERGMEKRIEGRLADLEGAGASAAELRSARRGLGRRYDRELRKIERRLRSPSRYL